MLRFRDGLVVVGCVFVGFVTSAGPGLVARAAEPPRWVEQVLTQKQSALSIETDDPARRVAQLEQRVRELEAERNAATAPASRAPSRELEAMIVQNRELAARNRALAAANQALAEGRLFDSTASHTACQTPRGNDPRAQIRYWAERLRDGDTTSWRLSTEQNAAVQVLLRHERELDPHNPWR